MHGPNHEANGHMDVHTNRQVGAGERPCVDARLHAHLALGYGLEFLLTKWALSCTQDLSRAAWRLSLRLAFVRGQLPRLN